MNRIFIGADSLKKLYKEIQFMADGQKKKCCQFWNLSDMTRNQGEVWKFWSLGNKTEPEERLGLCPEVVGSIELIEIEGKGRGYVATTEIARGELIMACRAEEIAYLADADASVANLNFEEDIKVGVCRLFMVRYLS